MLNIFRKTFIILFSLSILFTNIFCDSSPNTSRYNLGIKLPPGFKIEVYAANVPGARSMALGPKGVLFVGTRGQGKVYAVIDTNNDQKADQVNAILNNLNSPNGVAYKDGDLYVAEINRVLRFNNIMKGVKQPIIINDSFPGARHHGWKFIRFGPDNKLYVPVGAPCNICLSQDERYASIMRMNPDGTNLEVFAHGVRNTVGFDWNPRTNVLWFTDNGRDMLGDNIPPDELNRAPNKGMHFGYPFMHGKNIRDPEFGQGVDLSKYTPPVQELGPHVASLGMRFYTGDMFPAEYKNQIFIAEHGSWNRSQKIGYRVSLVRIDSNNNPISYEPFAEGWLNGSSVSGRPVDVQVMPDGALLVSDDYAGVIYRISYSKN